jgi:glycosyltransferase involved in cell wall biosynthesis
MEAIHLRILMVLDRVFPPDIRVEKEARALVKAGHEVFVLSYWKNGMRDNELMDNVNVIRWRRPADLLRSAWNYFFFGVSLVYPFWKKLIGQTVKRYGIQAIHVHDLPLVKTGLITARRNGIFLVADLHENYAEHMKIWRKEWGWRGSVLCMVIPIWRWKRLEKSCIEQADKVVTVVEEMNDYYATCYALGMKKTIVVMNVEDLKAFYSIKINKEICDTYKGSFNISYVGGFAQPRGLDTAIKAMPRILKRIPNAKLLLVGKDGKAYEEGLRNLCKKLNVEKHVVFTGWVPFQHVPSLISVSNVCLVPHHVSIISDVGVPHKLFQYMAMGKPVLVTNAKALKRIVEETKCGIVVPSGDHDRIAEAIIYLHDNEAYARKLGANGRRAVERKYNWQNESRKLCQIYEELNRIRASRYHRDKEQ